MSEKDESPAAHTLVILPSHWKLGVEEQILENDESPAAHTLVNHVGLHVKHL